MVAAIIAGTLVVSCSAGRAGSTTSSSGGRPPGTDGRGLVWLLTSRALVEVASDPGAEATLARGQVYELLRAGEVPFRGLPVVPAKSFQSVAALVSALSSGQLPPFLKAVLYDNEGWSLTPLADQRDPAGSTQEAAQAAATHGLQLLNSPAMSLVPLLDPSAASRADGYLAMDLAGTAARYAQVVDIQAQSVERDTAGFTAVVTAAARQARAARPDVVVLAGLTTNRAGGPVTLAQLEADVAATRALVDGYWLNVPPPVSCSACPADRHDLAIALLRWIGDGGGAP